jgi:gas vesicle protein GvpN
MPEEGLLTLLEPDLDSGFVVTPFVADLTEHALSYLQADLAVHFCGPAGTGKTALAMHVAAQLKRPIVLIHGDDEFKTADLVGAEYGFRLKRLRDQFIHSVTKIEEDIAKRWVDNRLTIACKHGFTLVYDEFTRSRPEANNTLLSILEEKLLDLPAGSDEEHYLAVHPEFRAIFTSNPEEYAGIHKAQDALKDRLVTIQIGHFDRDTEAAITRSRSGISEVDAKKIVDLVRAFREESQDNKPPSVRESIKIAKVLKAKGAHPSKQDPFFKQVCLHVLTGQQHVANAKHVKRDPPGQLLEELIGKYCSPRPNASELKQVRQRTTK